MCPLDWDVIYPQLPKRFVEILKIRFWGTSEAFFKLGQPNGQTGVQAILERFLVDLTTFSSERLIYEAGADLGPGLEQRRPAPRVYPGGVLDLDKIAEPTEIQRAQAQANRAAARKKIERERLSAAIQHVRQTEPDVTEHAAKIVALSAIKKCDKLVLGRDHRLFLADGTEVSAGEITDDHHGITLRDPQEPGYDSGRCVAKILAGRNGITIHSFAYGKRVYTVESSSEIKKTDKLRSGPEDSSDSAIPKPQLEIEAGSIHDTAETVLHNFAAETDPRSRIYAQGNSNGYTLVRVLRPVDGKHSRYLSIADGNDVLEPLTVDSLQCEINRKFEIFKVVEGKDGPDFRSIDCPAALAKHIMSLGRWPQLPILRGLSYNPLLTKTGEVISAARLPRRNRYICCNLNPAISRSQLPPQNRMLRQR